VPSFDGGSRLCAPRDVRDRRVADGNIAKALTFTGLTPLSMNSGGKCSEIDLDKRNFQYV
jgi:hypothetical protein